MTFVRVTMMNMGMIVEVGNVIGLVMGQEVVVMPKVVAGCEWGVYVLRIWRIGQIRSNKILCRFVVDCTSVCLDRGTVEITPAFLQVDIAILNDIILSGKRCVVRGVRTSRVVRMRAMSACIMNLQIRK